jgi:hypothetical protein
MTKRDIAPFGAPCWIDLLTSDQEASKRFYGDLFGWTIDDPGPDFGGYVNFLHEGIQVGGCMRNDGAGHPDAWSVYLAVGDAARTVDEAVSRGGETVVPPMPVADLGVMAVVTDAGGAVVGMWQPGVHKGFGIYGEPNTPAWFELHTRAYDATLDFYGKVFDWNTRVEGDTDEFRYTVLHAGDEDVAGVMDAAGFLPEGVPSHWAIYFAVDDADAALAKTEKLGGSIVQAAEDTPYGRLAEAADVTGAHFKVMAQI